MLHKKIVLLISPEPWNHIFVSKHHYAIELSKDNVVYFLNPPSEKPDDKIVVTQSNEPGVYLIDYAIPFRGLRFFPYFVRNRIEGNFLRSLEKKINKKIDVIWNFENSRFFDFRFAGKHVLKIYHQVDFNQDFHPKLAARTADFVFAVNDSIKNYLSSFNRVTKIPHGFSGKFTDTARKILAGEKVEIKRNKRLQVYYVGNLESQYLNYSLLLRLIQENTEVDFNLIGPYNASSKTKCFFEFGHVRLLGKRTPDEVMKLLDDADILLLLYQVELFSDQLTSSHKVLEYLASGKAIVSTHLKEYSDKSDLLYMANKSDEVIDLFKYCKSHFDEVNSYANMQKRINFAWNNTYTRHLATIEAVISTKNNCAFE